MFENDEKRKKFNLIHSFFKSYVIKIEIKVRKEEKNYIFQCYMIF
jgi:hypothetical protein